MRIKADKAAGGNMQNICGDKSYKDKRNLRSLEGKRVKRAKRKKTRTLTIGGALLGALSLFFMLLMLRNGAIAIECVKKGMKLCAETVIPSLFPFMVISELLVGCGIGERIGRLLKGPMSLFSASGEGGSAVILGALCGFPVGARTAVGLYDRGRISKKECEHLLTFSNDPSVAFIISSVGVSLYSNRKLGVAFLCLTRASSLLVGYLMKYCIYSREERASRKDTLPEPSQTRVGVKMLTGAVTSSAAAMLNVCAYVIFFSALIGALGSMLSHLGAGEELCALLYAVFEMSSGVSAASRLTNTARGLVLTAFSLGWSGISVHCQVASMCDGRGLDLKPYFAAKALQGMLCGIAVTAFLMCN